MCHMSCVPCQVCCFMCHMSRVRCRMANFFLFLDAVTSLVLMIVTHLLTDSLTHLLIGNLWSYTTLVLIIEIEIVTEFTK